MGGRHGKSPPGATAEPEDVGAVTKQRLRTGDHLALPELERHRLLLQIPPTPRVHAKFNERRQPPTQRVHRLVRRTVTHAQRCAGTVMQSSARHLPSHPRALSPRARASALRGADGGRGGGTGEGRRGERGRHPQYNTWKFCANLVGSCWPEPEPVVEYTKYPLDRRST
jgi:hypothetical protein